MSEDAGFSCTFREPWAKQILVRAYVEFVVSTDAANDADVFGQVSCNVGLPAQALDTIDTEDGKSAKGFYLGNILRMQSSCTVEEDSKKRDGLLHVFAFTGRHPKRMSLQP
jgi:hypothetical protein